MNNNTDEEESLPRGYDSYSLEIRNQGNEKSEDNKDNENKK